MPTDRAVPQAPWMSLVYRRLMRLPAGGPTGAACAAAGVACAIGLLVVHPHVDLPPLFDRGAERPPAATQSRQVPAAVEVRHVVPASAEPAHARVGGSSSRPHGSQTRVDGGSSSTAANDVPSSVAVPSSAAAPAPPSNEAPDAAETGSTAADDRDGEDRSGAAEDRNDDDWSDRDEVDAGRDDRDDVDMDTDDERTDPDHGTGEP